MVIVIIKDSGQSDRQGEQRDGGAPDEGQGCSQPGRCGAESMRAGHLRLGNRVETAFSRRIVVN